MTRLEQKAAAFRAIHAGEPFVMPNPWDPGSARMLEALGFQALATTSFGFACRAACTDTAPAPRQYSGTTMAGRALGKTGGALGLPDG